jgi:SHS2 domain-containing protein
MSNYKFFDHTADIGVEVTGRTRKALFVNAAEALFDVMIENKVGEESAFRWANQIALIGYAIRSKFIGGL